MMKELNSQLIVKEVVRRLQERQNGTPTIPIGVSARHCHLKEKDLEILFGKGYRLTKKSDLLQPGQFAANEVVTIAGPRGSIERVRVLGPLRRVTQVEVSQTDAIKLGLNPPIRESGNLQGSSWVTIVGPKGSIYLEEGLIIAQAHIHMPSEQACQLDVKDGEYVKVEIDHPIRPLSFEKVRIRISDNYVLEMHIDTDEANAGFIKSGLKGKLIKTGRFFNETGDGKAGPNVNGILGTTFVADFHEKLLTKTIIDGWKKSIITIKPNTIITPLARDAAKERGISIVMNEIGRGEAGDKGIRNDRNARVGYLD
ncbi:phosphate propanoyltransferase [Neobacillus vireti]|nr:phosphate propanoyltransferase [Neobacillus vireti]